MSKQATIKSQAYHNFIHSFRSDVTKEDYYRSIHYLMKYLHVTDYEELIIKDIKIIQKNIIDFLIYCKETHKLSPVTIHSYLAAIKRFYDMNDIILNWKKIRAYQGEFYRVVDDEAYTHEQIELLIDNANMRDKSHYLTDGLYRHKGGCDPQDDTKGSYTK